MQFLEAEVGSSVMFLEALMDSKYQAVSGGKEGSPILHACLHKN